MEKKKVSRFEWVFMQDAAKENPDLLEKHEPYTAEEEMQQREDNIKKQLENIFKRNPEA